MSTLKKVIIIQFVGSLMFFILSLLMAVILIATPFKETWSFAGVILILAVTCLSIGILTGYSVGRRGLIYGGASSLLFLCIVFVAVNLIFGGGFKADYNDIFYIIPVFLGAMGGAVGTNFNN